MWLPLDSSSLKSMSSCRSSKLSFLGWLTSSTGVIGLLLSSGSSVELSKTPTSASSSSSSNRMFCIRCSLSPATAALSSPLTNLSNNMRPAACMYNRHNRLIGRIRALLCTPIYITPPHYSLSCTNQTVVFFERS